MNQLTPIWITIFLLNITSLFAQKEDLKVPNITATYEIEIAAPIDSVWQALAIDYGGIGKWASGVNHVIESAGSGLTARRSCEISAAGFNDTKEQIIRFDPENYYYEFELYEGLPGFVDYSVNKDKLVAQGDKTRWISTNDMRVSGLPGLMMKGFMQKKLMEVLAAKARELKHFVETGKPHPDKRIAMAKLEDKELFVVEHTIDAPVTAVWKVLVDDFAQVADSSPLSPKSEFVTGYSKVEVGAQRYMYKSANLKKYFRDEIKEIDDKNYDFVIEVVEAKGYPNTFTELEFDLTSVAANQTHLAIIFSYQTKPKFLQKRIKKTIKRDIQDYIFALDHHIETGEKITNKNWNSIRQNYTK